jgi:hypothetical protein
MSVKSFNESNHDRFATEKQKRLKDNKATRKNDRQRFQEIDLNDLDSLDDFEYNTFERM